MSYVRGHLVVALLFAVSGCEPETPPATVPVPAKAGAVKTAATIRALRRAYDGAPPVIPHQNFGMTCVSCHTPRGMEVPSVGFAPPHPHEFTPGMSATSHCRQCHVFRETQALFVETDYDGLPQDLRKGGRLYPGAPPTMPHSVFMRENCAACHTGPAAREEIRCSHPERQHCRQCHAPVVQSAEFVQSLSER